MAMTAQQLECLLVQAIPQDIVLEKVYKHLDYAFVHFETRSDAERALVALQNNLLALGEDVEVVWARPKACSKDEIINHLPITYCK